MIGTLSLIILGASLVGAIAGGAGVFALVRQESLLGDAISHAALPGIALMFLFTESTNPFVLIIGGGIAGCIGALFVTFVLYRTPLKRDALLGIILSVFFGFGVVLKTVIQKRAIAHQAILGKFFFGNASTLLVIDVYILAILAVFLVVAFWVLWKEFFSVSFDRHYSAVQGYPVLLLDILLTFLIVTAIVAGLHTVGVLLMSALLISPAAAARQWTSSLKKMFWLSVLFGAFSGGCGALISSLARQLPTGPLAVVVASVLVLVSLLWGSERGILLKRANHE